MAIFVNGIEVAGLGKGVPQGGTVNQYLIKKSEADYDTMWADLQESNIENGEGALSIQMRESDNHANGENSTAFGFNNTALGDNSQAMGFMNLAEGWSSHAEGYGGYAFGWVSHAEGLITKAIGDISHAEGSGTLATGYESHAEGYYTVASGEDSHAEGAYTSAIGSGSHAEGYSAFAVGWVSHAEGGLHYTNEHPYLCLTTIDETTFSYTDVADWITLDEEDYIGYPIYSWSSYGGIDYPVCSFITNIDTENQIITIENSIFDSPVNGVNAYIIVAGAFGEYSHAEGCETVAMGYCSHSEGHKTTASGEYSHTEGTDTIASGEYGSHAEGCETVASGYDSHAEGYYAVASGHDSHAEGLYTTASGDGSHVEGYGTFAGSDYQHIQGAYNIIDENNAYVHIVGNGDDDDNRSNAHTLDWYGNAWFAGNIAFNAGGMAVTGIIVADDLPEEGVHNNGKICIVY